MKIIMNANELKELREQCRADFDQCKINTCRYEVICENMIAEKYPKDLTDGDIETLSKQNIKEK